MHVCIGQVIVLPTCHASDDNNNMVNHNALKTPYSVSLEFRSKLEYSSAVWTPYSGTQSIFNV